MADLAIWGAVLAGGAIIALLVLNGDSSDSDDEGDDDPQAPTIVTLSEGPDNYIAADEGAADLAQIIYGGEDVDYIRGGSANDVVYGGDSGRVEQDYEQYFWFDEILDGGGGNDTVYGGAGPDAVFSASGDDVLYGGSDEDNLRDQALPVDQVRLRLAGDEEGILGVAGQPLSDDDRVYGGEGDDLLDSFQGADQLYGDSGDDALYAYEEGALVGQDILYGGPGDDRLFGDDGDIFYGGEGRDSFFLASAPFPERDLSMEAPLTLQDFDPSVERFRVFDLLEESGGPHYGLFNGFETTEQDGGTMLQLNATLDGEAVAYSVAFFVGVTPSAIDAAIAEGRIDYHQTTA